MKFLLDTHIFLWWILQDPKLSRMSGDVIADPGNELYFSAASTWEMVIKSAIGKLSLPSSPETFVKEQLFLNDITPLPVTMAHTFALAGLPLIHKDPFDRMLIAQTLYENLTLITDDPTIKQYDVNIL
jgi:PIN domain nuclease of toxin-antitoxin system